jgi:hypothetical protein
LAVKYHRNDDSKVHHTKKLSAESRILASVT